MEIKLQKLGDMFLLYFPCFRFVFIFTSTAIGKTFNTEWIQEVLESNEEHELLLLCGYMLCSYVQ